MGILEWIQNIDAQILLFIQQYIRQDMMNWFWKGITFLGDGGWFWIVLGVVLLIPKKTRKSGFTALLALIIGSVITNLVLKTAVARIRPYDAVEGLVPLVKKLRDYSFPSGHTCASFSCAVVYYKMYPDYKRKGSYGTGRAHCVVKTLCGRTLSHRCSGRRHSWMAVSHSGT